MKDKKHFTMIKHYYDTWKRLTPNICLEIEAPYNFFGDRGIVDLVSYTWQNEFVMGKCILPATAHIGLHEFKTEIFDLGETLRQIKKAQKYFLLANDSVSGIKIREKNKAWVWSYLILLDTPENLSFLCEYRTQLADIKHFSCGLLLSDDRGFNKDMFPFFHLQLDFPDLSYDYIPTPSGIRLEPHGTGKGIEKYMQISEKHFVERLKYLNSNPSTSINKKGITSY